MEIADFLVIGGGIIGINIAYELKKRNHGARVLLIEKEVECGWHASGRNSGVLHAGFYYSADSLKAKFTREGNRLLTEYCERRNLAINKCGKLVVAQNETDLDQLDELLRRGEKNQIDLQEISEADAKQVEPRVRTHQRALFSPTTSSIDPVQVLQTMKGDALREGVEVKTGVRYLKGKGKRITTSRGMFEAGYIVNCSGLYADQVAQDYGFSRDYRILPFKGLYLYSDAPPRSLRTHIYPVPDLRNPFLGVHWTVTVDGKSKIGPTAMPAFWREQYSGLGNFNFAEFIEIMLRQMGLFVFSQFDFKKLAWEEIRKYSRSRLVALAASLLEGAKKEKYSHWGKPGIRAQLLNIKEKKLIMDFVIEGDDRSMHVLNAVSPAFTCAIPFARFVCDEIRRLSN